MRGVEYISVSQSHASTVSGARAVSLDLRPEEQQSDKSRGMAFLVCPFRSAGSIDADAS